MNVTLLNVNVKFTPAANWPVKFKIPGGSCMGAGSCCTGAGMATASGCDCGAGTTTHELSPAFTTVLLLLRVTAIK